MVQLRAGMHLVSVVSPASVIVLRAPKKDVEVCCGGVAMAAADNIARDVEVQATGNGSGNGLILGKRYAHESSELEFLCTRAGAGELTVDGEPFILKDAKPLPPSD
jgi:hypothetical protein